MSDCVESAKWHGSFFYVLKCRCMSVTVMRWYFSCCRKPDTWIIYIITDVLWCPTRWFQPCHHSLFLYCISTSNHRRSHLSVDCHQIGIFIHEYAKKQLVETISRNGADEYHAININFIYFFIQEYSSTEHLFIIIWITSTFVYWLSLVI